MPDNFTDSDLMMQPDVNNISGLPRDDLDLLVVNGDLAFQNGIDNLKASILRRLKTPLGYCGIIIVSYDDYSNIVVVRVGSDYGSTLGLQISEPMTNDWIRNVIQTINTVLQQETLIQVGDIVVNITDPTTGQVSFQVSYSIIETGTSGNLSLQVGGGALAIN